MYPVQSDVAVQPDVLVQLGATAHSDDQGVETVHSDAAVQPYVSVQLDPKIPTGQPFSRVWPPSLGCNRAVGRNR